MAARKADAAILLLFFLSFHPFLTAKGLHPLKTRRGGVSIFPAISDVRKERGREKERREKERERVR